MSIYLDNGYVNIGYCLGFGCNVVILIGGRATGKTYGSLQYAINNDRNIILMRRTQSQADLINKPEFSPVNPVVNDMGRLFHVKQISKYNSGLYLGEDEKLLGYTAALSTFSNLRGFDSSGVDLLIYDEFIPETHERPIKGEGLALLNVYETINRNRELQGRAPLQMLLLSNANRLDSPILETLGLVNVVDRMRSKGQSEWINRDRGIAVFMLQDSPISKAKAETALYKMVGESSFSDMSLKNDFAFDDMADVRSLPLAGWKLQAQIGQLYIYKKDNHFYISRHCAGTPKKVYEDTEIDRMRFVRENPRCREKILTHKIFYEDYTCKTYLTNLYI